MFDDFREEGSDMEFDESEEPSNPYKGLETDVSSGPRQYFLGMTPFQRFFISLELFFMVCITGAFILLVLGRVAPSFAN
jgi:hypothetical protein